MDEVLDPMVLSSKMREQGCHNAVAQIPAVIGELFDEELITGSTSRYLLVTLGQFSIVRLERDAQLVVPVLEYSIPSKECCDSIGCAEDPCEMFSRIPFPTRQFTPTGCDHNCREDSCNRCDP